MNKYLKRDDETTEDWLKRVSAAGERSINNIEKIKADMKKDGVVGFCSECGCNIYKDKEHVC